MRQIDMPDPTFEDDEGFYWKLTAMKKSDCNDYELGNCAFYYSKDLDTPEKLLKRFIYTSQIMF